MSQHLPITDVTTPARGHAHHVRHADDASVASGSHPSRPDLREDDLHDLLVAFYDTVGADPLLAPYFAAIDMQDHIPRIADFWATLVFGARRYTGNAFRPHAVMPNLTGPHFARWLDTLEATIDARFAGPAAEQMKALGHRIAYSMQLRLGIPPFEALRTVP